MDILKAWFLRHGGILHEGVELVNGSQGYYLCSRVETSLAVDSLIISCPNKLTISWLNAKESLPENFVDSSVPYVATRFFLIQQRLLCDKSFWWPYIQALPGPSQERLHTPMWYSKEDLLWIKGTNLEAAVWHRTEKWRREYEDGIQLLSLSEKQRKEWSWELYLWAATMLSSRCFPGSAVGLQPEYPVLLPVFDIANHSPAAKVKWEWNDSSCCLYNGEPLRGGQAIWNNYGAKSNEELIMGYGFSLFRNPSDQFALETASSTSSKIIAIKAYQKLCSHVTRTSNSNGRPKSPLSTKTTSTEVYWIRLSTHNFLNYVHAAKVLRFFPQGLLDEVSVIIANERELARTNVAPYRYWVNDGEDSRLTRNRLNVMCHLTMLLQKHRGAIKEYDSSLPPWPRNEKQFHAARYQRSQLRILDTVVEALLNSLREAVNPSSYAGLNEIYIVTLEDILSSSPLCFSHDFRSALKTALHTRSAVKIRQNGWVDLVFTLWICGLWVWESLNLSDDDVSTNFEDEATDFHKAITHWLSFIRNTYPRTLTSQDPLPPSVTHQWSSSNPRTRISPSTHGGTTSLTPEIFHIAESYVDIIHVIADHDPGSIFAHKGLTLERLAWGLNIVKQEGFMCPGLQGVDGEERDEWCLCLEREREVVKRIEDVGSVARGRVVEKTSVFASSMTV